MRYILWTGGIDSTYLLCKCARENDEPIQPLYIVFNRPVAKSKSERELDAQKALLRQIRGKEDILAEIKEPILLQETELPENKEFDAIYDKANDGSILFTRRIYKTFARLSKTYPELMIGIEAPNPAARPIGRTEKAFKNYGISIDDAGNVILNEGGNKDVFAMFKDLMFPIIHVNPVEEIEAFKKWGYDDIPSLCRTCTADLDYQCGVCPYCELKMESEEVFKELMPRGYINHKIKEYLIKVDQMEGTRYAQFYTLFIWGDEILRGGWCEGYGESAYISKETAQNMTLWFNALRKAYPNFKKVDKAQYGF